MSHDDIARAAVIKYLESNAESDSEHRNELLQEAQRLKSIWLIQSATDAPDLIDLIPIYSNEQKSKIFRDAGNVALGHGNFDEAIDKLTEAINLTPDEIELYMIRANAFLKKGLYLQAIQDLKYYISKNNNNPSAHLRLSYAYSMVEENENAINVLQNGLTLFPEDHNLLSTKNLILTGQ